MKGSTVGWSPMARRMVLMAVVAAAAALMATLWAGGAGGQPARADQIAELNAAVAAAAFQVTEDGGDGAGTRGSNDYFLKIDGIEGESRDERHGNEIEILSWSWGETNAGSPSAGRGGGAGAGKVSMQDFHFTSLVSSASPELFLAVPTGKHYPEAVLTVRRAGGDQQDYLIVTMEDILITSYQTGGSNGEVPVDQFSLDFGAIKFEYKPQKEDGSLGDSIEHSWDVKSNKGA